MESIKRRKEDGEWLISTTASAALACLLMLCYQFSINPLLNRRAKAPVLILPDSVPLPSASKRINAVSLAKVRPTPSTERWQHRRTKKRESQPGFLLRTRKLESSKDTFVQRQWRKTGRLQAGDQFSPLRVCVVSQLNAERLLEWKGGIALFFHLKRAEMEGAAAA